MITLEIIEDASADAIDCAAILKDCQEVEVVAKTNKGDEAINLAAKLQPNIILLSDTVGRDETTTLTEQLHTACTANILITGSSSKDGEILGLLKAGANGYLNKTSIPVDLEKAIKAMTQGEAWISRKMVALILQQLRIVSSVNGTWD